MKNIILFYDSNDKSADDIKSLLLAALDSDCSLTTVQKETDIHFDNCIAVFCATPKELSEQFLPEYTIAVCDPSDKTALEVISKNKIPAVTAGMSGLYTVTLSSISDDSATICVLRKITSLSGKITEPCEFSVSLSKPYSCRTISIFCAVMLLLDKMPKKL